MKSISKMRGLLLLKTCNFRECNKNNIFYNHNLFYINNKIKVKDNKFMGNNTNIKFIISYKIHFKMIKSLKVIKITIKVIVKLLIY